MDDNQKKIATWAFLAVLIIMFFFYLMIGKSSDKPILKKRISKEKKDRAIKKKRKVEHQSSTSSRSFSARRSVISTRPVYSDELVLKMKKSRAKAKSKLKKIQEKWLFNKVENTSLSQKTREKYRFRLIKSYKIGIDALKNKNYVLALREFKKSLKDPMASPVTKYMAYMYMRSAAQKIGDMELFFLIAEEQANLIATEDLSMLGVRKGNKQKIWVKQFKEVMGAATNKNKFKSVIDKLVADRRIPPDKRGEAEERLRKEIDGYRSHFKEFFKNDV